MAVFYSLRAWNHASSIKASPKGKMKQFLAVVLPFAGNFVAWSLITFLPVHSIIIFALAIASGVLMLYGIVYLTRLVDKNQSAKGKS
jgi:hypothetical protein